MDLHLSKIPVAKTGMLIRRSAHEVYEAFINPKITTRFWFTKSTGPLEAGKRIRWEWEMYGVSSLVEVKQLEPDQRILLDWGLDEAPSTVEWTFTARSEDLTFVSISNSGFIGDGDALMEQALSSAEGFALVLAGLKACLEYGININLIADRHPDLLVDRQT